jgi:hypothetical protein
MALPIEEHPDLLQEYGRAFAYLNLLENTLKNFLIIKRGLNNGNDILRANKQFDSKMMGEKIELAKSFLNDQIIAELENLNNKRKLLAHGITGGGEEIIIFHKKEAKPFNKELLEDIVSSARQLHIKLLHELL